VPGGIALRGRPRPPRCSLAGNEKGWAKHMRDAFPECTKAAKAAKTAKTAKTANAANATNGGGSSSNNDDHDDGRACWTKPSPPHAPTAPLSRCMSSQDQKHLHSRSNSFTIKLQQLHETSDKSSGRSIVAGRVSKVRRQENCN